MSDMIASAFVEGARALTRIKTEEARYAYLSGTSNTRKLQNGGPSVGTSEIVLPNIELNNYTTRAEVEGGEHILVTTHNEHIEKKFVPTPPPTPQEIADAHEHKKFMAKVWASVASVALVVTGVVVVFERRNADEPEHH